jgi:hypothetical protein
MNWDFKGVSDYVKKELGAPFVSIELKDENIWQCIENALRILNNWACEAALNVAYEQTDSVVLQLDDAVRGLLEVKILPPSSQRIPADINIFEIIYRMVFPKFPISDWYMFRGFYETFQRVKGTEPDWRWDAMNKKLYVDCWSGPYDIFYVTARDLTLESFSASQGQYSQMFLDLVVARAKQTLAMIRGKFGDSIPAPGGAVSTDAAALRTSGQEKEKEVIERLQKRARFAFVGMVG